MGYLYKESQFIQILITSIFLFLGSQKVVAQTSCKKVFSQEEASSELISSQEQLIDQLDTRLIKFNELLGPAARSSAFKALFV